MKHSEETKIKLSRIRKEWLKNNPDKHPWKRKDKFISKPCEIFKNKLKEANISFKEELTPLENRNYSIDVALPEKGIGFEINGNQHYNSDKTLKKYYKERKENIEKNGWKLYDIHYTKIFDKEFISDIIDFIQNKKDGINLEFNFIKKKENFCIDCDKIISKNSKNRCLKCHNINRRTDNFYKTENKIFKIKLINFCIDCGKEINIKSKICTECNGIKQRKIKNRPSIELLLKEVEKNGYCATGRKYEVSDNTIRKWLK